MQQQQAELQLKKGELALDAKQHDDKMKLELMDMFLKYNQSDVDETEKSFNAVINAVKTFSSAMPSQGAAGEIPPQNPAQ